MRARPMASGYLLSVFLLFYVYCGRLVYSAKGYTSHLTRTHIYSRHSTHMR